MNLSEIMRQEAKRRGFTDEEIEEAFVEEVKKTRLVVDCTMFVDDISREAVKELCSGYWSLVRAREREVDISVPSASFFHTPVFSEFIDVMFRKEKGTITLVDPKKETHHD